MSQKTVTVYIDGVDWQYEIGHAMDGNRVYPSLEDLAESNSCWESCGVVKATITFEKWVTPQDLSKGKLVSSDELQTPEHHAYEKERRAAFKKLDEELRAKYGIKK